MSTHYKCILLTASVLLIPFSAEAAQSASTVQDVLTNIGNIIQAATPVVVALAVLGFFWGLMLYVFSVSDTEKRKKGLPMMIWGIVALFVIFSIFGIINILQGGLGVGQGNIQAPVLTPSSGTTR